jgi:hypothetical protein
VAVTGAQLKRGVWCRAQGAGSFLNCEKEHPAYDKTCSARPRARTRRNWATSNGPRGRRPRNERIRCPGQPKRTVRELLSRRSGDLSVTRKLQAVTGLRNDPPDQSGSEGWCDSPTGFPGAEEEPPRHLEVKPGCQLPLYCNRTARRRRSAEALHVGSVGF